MLFRACQEGPKSGFIARAPSGRSQHYATRIKFPAVDLSGLRSTFILRPQPHTRWDHHSLLADDSWPVPGETLLGIKSMTLSCEPCQALSRLS